MKVKDHLLSVLGEAVTRSKSFRNQYKNKMQTIMPRISRRSGQLDIDSSYTWSESRLIQWELLIYNLCPLDQTPSDISYSPLLPGFC